jgi:hypothetical protein
VPWGPALLLPLAPEHRRGGAVADAALSAALLAAMAPLRKPGAPTLDPGELFQLKWSSPGAAAPYMSL